MGSSESVATVPIHSTGRDLVHQAGNDIEASPGAKHQGSPQGFDALAKCAEGVAQPPLRCPSQWTGAFRYFVVHVHQDQWLAPHHGGVERGVVGEPQVVSKPDNARTRRHENRVEVFAGVQQGLHKVRAGR